MAYEKPLKVCCCCDVRLGVIFTNSIIVFFGILFAILGATVFNNEDAFKDCHEYCQADTAGREKFNNDRNCYLEKWMKQCEPGTETCNLSDECQALAWGQGDEAKSLGLANLAFSVIGLVACLCAIVGAASFRFSLVKVQMVWLPIAVLYSIIGAGISGSALAKYNVPTMIIALIAINPIVSILFAAGLVWAEYSLVTSGVSRLTYKQNCCSGPQKQGAQGGYDAPPVQATVVQATVAQGKV